MSENEEKMSLEQDLEDKPLHSHKTLTNDQWKQYMKALDEMSKTARVPKEGFTYNPLLNLPRNMPCPCLSGKKFKACHLGKLPAVIPNDMADNYKKAMSMTGGLRFVSQNKDKEAEP